ncbi:MAG: phosphohydrolase [Citromicrobium sp.]|nr:MAG: phosphohydrolase [Citromicrobium sp.]
MVRAKGKPGMQVRWTIAAALAVLALLLGAKAWSDTMCEPIVHRTTVAIPDLPHGESLRIVLISDIHVAGPDMPPERLETIVDRVNALDPDVVAIAGDLVSDKRTATHIYTPEEIVAPLARLEATYGTIVVPGNHDHWFDLPGLRQQLDRHGIAHRANGGGSIMLSHSPDPAARVPDSIRLVLAGHTHCGQIAYPWGGAPAHLSDYGDRFACGRIDEGPRTVIVGSGLGTSLIPVRLFTQPEIWSVTVVGE